MKFFLPIIFLCISRNVIGHRIAEERIHYDDELSYQELISMNASCYPLDLCMQDRTEDPLVPAFGYMCSCNKQCGELGTCCIDSPYKDMPPTQKCRNTAGTYRKYGYYMVYKCPDNTNADSIWKNQCEKEWNEEDDISMLSPVTSLDTSLTYKNYYCFRCHETTDKYVSWNLFLDSSYNVSGDMNVSSVAYNQEENTWMAILDENQTIPTNFSFHLPYDVEIYPISCNLDMIADCPDTWTDRHVHKKCLAYTAVVYQEFSSYKNVHCALCNNVSLEVLTCNETSYGGYGGKEIFSFRQMLDINDSTGDKVGNAEKCDDGHTWDPYSKKCRKQTCAIPGYVIENDRCVPP